MYYTGIVKENGGDLMKYCVNCGAKWVPSLEMVNGAAVFSCKCGFRMPLTWCEMVEASIKMYKEVLLNYDNKNRSKI